MKPLMVISCPLETMSGYGARSRDIVKALLKYDKYDIKVISQRWGNTSYNVLNPDVNEDKQLLDLIWRQSQLPKQPDIWIQITVPNEFQPVGKFNIGITAGIETTICDPPWIEGINRMNLTLVSSNHAKQVFQQSSFEQRDNNTNQVIKQIKLEKPIEVLFEGVDLNKYFYVPDEELDGTDVIHSLDEIEEEFCFLFVGHWLQGQIGEDRKNVGYTIKAFLETFKNKKTPPALILKTSQVTNSIMDREEILKKIDDIKQTVKGNLPNIYLLHGDLDDKDINDLYNHGKVKAMVSLTKGEGYGRPLLEFSLSKKPIIVSNWSGHIDFLHPEYNTLINGTLTNVHQSAQAKNMILAESKWFTPNDKEVADAFKNIYDYYSKYLENAKRQAHYAKTNFSFDKMAEVLDSILEAKVPKHVELKLPTLKKIGSTENKIELPKLNLPKLKKVE
jgi:glycosyltransferase involved in cell wall biosynthesis